MMVPDESWVARWQRIGNFIIFTNLRKGLKGVGGIE